jgi:hypothetical protein
MEETINKMIEIAQEYGDLHAEYCPCMTDAGDTCDCDEMKKIELIH